MGQEHRLSPEIALGRRPTIVNSDGGRRPAGNRTAAHERTTIRVKLVIVASGRDRATPDRDSEFRHEAPAEDGREWAEHWRAKQIQRLHRRAEALEQQLRRRTTALTVTLALGGFVTGAAALGGAVLLLDRTEPRWVGRIADGGPAPGRMDAAAAQPEPAPAQARQQDLVVRALQAANEEIEAVIGRVAAGGREP